MDCIIESPPTVDLFTVDLAAIAMRFGSRDARLEMALLEDLREDCEDQDENQAEQIIEKLTPGIRAVVSGDRVLDESGRWGFYYLARHVAEEDGCAGLQFFDPALDGSAGYLLDYDNKLREAEIKLPMSLLEAALRGVPQIGNLQGVACYPAAGRPVDFFPTLGFITPAECRASYDVIATVERTSEVLSDLLGLFAQNSETGHGVIICVSDWFPQAVP